jgi:hypothetical protein
VDGRLDDDSAGSELFAEALRPAVSVQVENILVAIMSAIIPHVEGSSATCTILPDWQSAHPQVSDNTME